MGISLHISKEEVFGQLGCGPESEAFATFEEEYEEIREEILRICSPMILLREGMLPQQNQPALYVFATIGKRPEQLSTKAFDQGDYVKGMLVDAAADAALFSMEQEIRDRVKQYCREHGTGIAKRLEAPEGMPMEMQKTIYDAVEGERFGIRISEGFMFDPVKSSAIAFLLTEDTSMMKAEHNCADCSAINCAHRREKRQG
ncbi:MAG: hypothetical protein PHR92_02110 [Lachnospiraceae bacterium]|nr:hypothetical protein [Lachnospiraceae bacterium]